MLKDQKLKVVVVWLLRLIVGATFVFSGFVKAIDPWGFIYKLQDYLAAWDINFFPRPVLLCFSVAIAMVEFTSGVLLVLGCLRRATVWTLAAMMAFMLPLTFYIMIANPVSDCGCFGDVWVISNTATFIKNVILTALVVLLVLWNTQVKGLITPLLQWIAATACVLFCLIISLLGYLVQPLMDFRSFHVGSELISQLDDSQLKLVYEKDGQEKAFGVEELPDSTWTFVRREGSSEGRSALNIYDGDEEVSESVIAQEGPQLILTVPDPELHNRARSRLCNRLAEYMSDHGGDMIALVGAEGEELEHWKKLATPTYEVFSVESTQLKELARGDAALVFVQDGRVGWKFSLYSLAGDYPQDDDFAEFTEIEDDSFIRELSTLLGCVLLVLVLISLIPSKKKKEV